MAANSQEQSTTSLNLVLWKIVVDAAVSELQLVYDIIWDCTHIREDQLKRRLVLAFHTIIFFTI